MKKTTKRIEISILVALVSIILLLQTQHLFAGEKNGNGKNDNKLGNVRIIDATDLKDEEWNTENYLIDTGDTIEISVWQVDELSRAVVVRPDGKISFPLIGDVVALGRSIDELKDNISDKLKVYIKDPKVTAIVKKFGGKKIIVLGEVVNRGIIRFTEPIRVMEALALSGSYTESANIKSVLIIRGDLKNNTDIVVVNVMEIIKGNLRHNIYMQKHDIIFVPRSFVGNVAYFVRQLTPLLTGARQYTKVKDTIDSVGKRN